MIIESDDRSFRLDLPKGMTVVAGAGSLERDGLINEVLGALGRGRPGVHAEFHDDAGTRYAIFRPAGGRACVVDIEAAVDVTHKFTCYEDVLDPLGRAGMGSRESRRVLRLAQADLAAASHEERMILALAQVEQGRLWELANRVVECEQALNVVAESGGSTMTDATVMEEIDRHHAKAEKAEAQLEEMRSASFIVAGGAGVILLPAAVLVGLLGALPFALLAVAATAVSVAQWRRAEEARRAEDQALRAAGADSYLSYQVHRANTMSGDAAHRRRMLVAANAHRSALASWKLLVGGDIPVEWALLHQGKVRATARRLRSSGAVRNPMAVALSAGEASAAQLTEALEARLESARTAGPSRDSAPLLIDDAFRELPPQAKSILLEKLMTASRHQQVIYFTDDEDVAEWARLEAINGGLDIIEPKPDNNGRKRSSRGPRHVVA